LTTQWTCSAVAKPSPKAMTTAIETMGVTRNLG
jgi:hypothetical protein